MSRRLRRVRHGANASSDVLVSKSYLAADLADVALLRSSIVLRFWSIKCHGV